MDKRLTIVTGHYGSGKTEFAVNLAYRLPGEKRVLADLDIVNPYFCSREKEEELERAGIRVILPTGGGHADLPSLSPALNTVFSDTDVQAVFDMGGDPAGARVLKRFAPELSRTPFSLLCVVNFNRPETGDAEKAAQYIRGIECACGQRVTGLVHNTHLLGETEPQDVLDGAALCRALSVHTGLPIFCHAVDGRLAEALCGRLPEPVFPMTLYMKKPWETAE